MKFLLIISTLLFVNSNISVQSEQIVGKWMSEDKDMKVEVFKVNDHYVGKLVWFACDPTTPDMESFMDINNPDPKLRNRLWLGMVVLNNLKFDGKGEWNGGSIYDPNSGRTYKSVVRLNSPQELIVRGYWGIKLFGKSLKFNKINL